MPPGHRSSRIRRTPVRLRCLPVGLDERFWRHGSETPPERTRLTGYAREQIVLREFDELNHLTAINRRKSFQEIVNRAVPFQMIDERLDRHARSFEAQGPPGAAPNSTGTHPSSRSSAAITCASSSKAQGPPDAAPNSTGTRPVQPRPAALVFGQTTSVSGKPGRRAHCAVWRWQRRSDSLPGVSPAGQAQSPALICAYCSLKLLDHASACFSASALAIPYRS